MVFRPEILRGLDRLLGVPACWLLTMLRKLSRRRAGRLIRRALFIQLAESGSMVLADPAMTALGSRCGTRPYCVTLDRNRSSLAITNTVPRENIYIIRTDRMRHFIADIAGIRGWCRDHRIDAVVDLELFTRFSALLGVWSGVPLRAGFHSHHGPGLYRGNLYSHPVAYNPHIHMARNYLQLVQALKGAKADSPAPQVDIPDQALALRLRTITPGERNRVRETLPRCLAGWEPGSRLVLVNPNASNLLPQRRWPEGRFIELIRRILEEFPDCRVLLIGAQEDRPATRTILETVAHPRCGDGAGRFALEDLPALFSLASLMVSNDSGPAHFAAVTRLPVVVLFGPETPTLFKPLGNAIVISANLACSPCVHAANQRRTPCRDNQCMQRIEVATVMAAARQELNRARIIPFPRRQTA